MRRIEESGLQNEKAELEKLASEFWKMTLDPNRLNREDARRFENTSLVIPELDFYREEESRSARAMRRSISELKHPAKSDAAHVQAIEKQIAAMQERSARINAAIAKSSPEETVSHRKLVERSVDLLQRYDVVAVDIKALHASYENFVRRATEPGTFDNWTEQEADEVGYEYFLRAGFVPESFLFNTRVSMGRAAFDTCVRNHVTKGVPPPRGSANHPEHCWRVFDLLYYEPKIHAESFAPLLKNANRKMIDESGLARAQANLKATRP